MNRVGRFQPTSLPSVAPLRTLGAPAAQTPSLGRDQLDLGAATTHNSVKLLLSPEETNQALLDSIRNAKQSYLIETFIWHDDESGRLAAQALADRKRQATMRGEPFEAKVLIDSSGMRDQPKGGSFKNIQAILEAAGVEVKVFNPTYVSLEAMGVPITHRKLYISDAQSFISGGRNIADEYLEPTFGPDHAASWHDLAYSVTGDEAARETRLFYDHWVQSGGKAPASLPAPVPSTGHARIQVAQTDPRKHLDGLRQAQDALIKSARSEIVAIYPYLTDDHMIDQLIAAKKANPALHVRVMMPSGSEGGLMNVFPYLHDVTAQQLMEAGIEVRWYAGDTENGQLVSRWSHLKGLMIDDKVLSIGSANADARSFTSNYELNTIIEDPATLQDFKQRVVEPDWAAGQIKSLDEIKHQPWYKKLFAKILEWFDFLA